MLAILFPYFLFVCRFLQIVYYHVVGDKNLPSIIKNLSYSAKISASFCSISSPLKSRARIVPSGEKSII